MEYQKKSNSERVRVGEGMKVSWGTRFDQSRYKYVKEISKKKESRSLIIFNIVLYRVLEIAQRAESDVPVLPSPVFACL